MRTMKTFLVTLALSTAAVASVAHAEEKAAAPQPDAVTTLPIKIKSRAPRPQIVTEVARITPAGHLAELRQPLLDRVEKAIEKAPF